MKVMVLAVGGLRGALAEVVADYETRAARAWKLEVREVPAGVRKGKGDPLRIMEEEARRLRALVPAGFERVALTRTGRAMDSVELAEYLEERAVRSAPGVAFLIGGAFGLSPELMAEAERTLSLSRMTLPHEIARLVLAEQLYRAGTILRGEPYHKGRS